MSIQGFEKFPQFLKQEVSNLLMFPDNFESFDWTLKSLRSPLPAVGVSSGNGLLPKFL